MDEEQRPLDRSPYYVTHSEHLDRVLSRPQLAGEHLSHQISPYNLTW